MINNKYLNIVKSNRILEAIIASKPLSVLTIVVCFSFAAYCWYRIFKSA